MKKPEKGHAVSKVQRIADDKVIIHHENGNTFEGDVDRSKIRFREDSWGNKYFFGGLGRKGGKVGNVMSNEDRRRMGVDEDPSLPDYEGTKVNSKGSSSDPNLAK